MPDPDGDRGDRPAIRASDDERQQVVDRLGDHAAAGRITLAEWEDRVGRAYHATTRADLAALTTDLPALSEEAESPSRQRRRARWSVAILGGSTWRARKRSVGQLHVVAVLGGDDLDLREVEIEGHELVVNVVSVLGGPTIYLPDTVDVELTGLALLGGDDEHGSARRPRPGAPVIRIRSFALLGGADVWRLPADTRSMSLRDAKRVAKRRRSERG